MKAILTCLNTAYEQTHRSSTGKFKRDYVGQIGEVVHVQTLVGGSAHCQHHKLYNIKFDDGAILCCDNEQVRVIKEN